MSNNQPAESDEVKYLPKLRFVEFKNSDHWSLKELDQIATFLKGKGISKTDIDPNGITLCIRYGELYTTYNEVINQVFSKTNISKDNLILSKRNDVIIPASGETHADIAKASCVIIDDIALGGDLNIIRSKQNGSFISYYLNSPLKTEIAKIAQGNAVVHLYANQLKKLKIAIPTLTEQQKIVDCLSSLDELIQNESSTLEGYKQHKSGLLQQLFPRDGESLPKIRFDEFSEEWNLNAFSNYIKLYRGSSPRPISEFLTKDEDGINWIKIGDTKNSINSVIYNVDEKITKQGAKKSRSVKKGELILANSMSYGKAYELAIDGCIYDGWFVLRDFEKYFHKPFLLQLLNSDYMQQQYQRLAAGGIVQNISSDIVYKSLLPHTLLEEQKKIAKCLCSLDNLITCQTDYIEQLKQHKKGLMQQLFPVPEDTST